MLCPSKESIGRKIDIENIIFDVYIIQINDSRGVRITYDTYTHNTVYYGVTGIFIFTRDQLFDSHSHKDTKERAAPQQQKSSDRCKADTSLICCCCNCCCCHRAKLEIKISASFGEKQQLLPFFGLLRRALSS